MTIDKKNRHLPHALKLVNIKLTFEVEKLRIDLALIKDKASLCEELKCELKFYKEELS